MNPDQVKQATDALISDRNRLGQQQASAPAATGSTLPAGSTPKP
jgi:hypothetical protein